MKARLFLLALGMSALIRTRRFFLALGLGAFLLSGVWVYLLPAEAQYRLAYVCMWNYGFNNQSKGLLRLAAERGHPKARVYLGRILWQSDREESIRLWTAAAEQGDSEAQFSLYIHAVRSPGVPSDEAVRRLNQAAAQGHPGAEGWMAGRYMGRGSTPMDFDKAVYWLRRAAEHGNESARLDLRNMRAKGIIDH